ncbi:YggS family pyridoxal phosphate-dependent enzyme [Litoribacterium kuwaitense]|uniref:YggS family pyridoxal phosphate-dependent enzyme n=1 Tax=Litoribacterium kuwaitense TaxID=1398745 RepID=UPI001BA69822
MNSIQDNIAKVQSRISEACARSGRQPADVTLIAVTKYTTVDIARELVKGGIQHLGENRIEGFQETYEALKGQADFHFIGSLQTRKVKDVIDQVDRLHSLDRLKLAKEIDKRAQKKVSCFVQVNVSGEESKHGLAPVDVVPFIQELEVYPRINVCGLMTMAPHTPDESLLRHCFQQLARLKEEVQALKLPFAPCHELSMGMSGDFEIAIEEGATHIRIGSMLVQSNT